MHIGQQIKSANQSTRFNMHQVLDTTIIIASIMRLQMGREKRLNIRYKIKNKRGP